MVSLPPIKTLFFGTHNFATAILKGLIDSPFIEVVGVVTQPDKPAGRHHEVAESPVKKLARKKLIPIFQPTSLNNFDISPFRDYDLFIVCQYGLIIPKNVLDTPKQGSVNVHASLLPKYRGASPIQYALINGEKETGITIILMDEKMDHGPILAQDKIAIAADDTHNALSEKLAKLGNDLLIKTIPDWVEGKIVPQEQDHAQATFTKILKRDDGRISFDKTAEQIYNLYRGLTPWPGIWTMWEGKRIKLLRIKPTDETIEPGLVVIKNASIYIGCASGSIQALELQMEGKKAMDARIFLQGYTKIAGAKVE